MSKIKRFFRRKSLLRNIIVGILIVVTVGAAVGGVVALTRNTDKIDDALNYKTINSLSYKIGALDRNGKYQESDLSLYTKDAFECKGLEIVPDFDANLTYTVFFYADDSAFISKTGALSSTFDASLIPTNAKFARIMITPLDIKKVTFFNIRSFARKLTVRVYRDQGFQLVDAFVVDSAMMGKYYNTTSGEVVASTAYNVSAKVSVENASRVRVDFPDISDTRTSGTFIVYFWNADSIVSFSMLSDSKYFSGTSFFVDVPVNAETFCLAYYSNVERPSIFIL